MNSRQKKNKYKAQGYIEALIAIAVAGIASIALMAVAARTLSNVVENELEDQLSREAVKGSKLLNFKVEDYIAGDQSRFFPVDLNDSENAGFDVGSCYHLKGDLSEIDNIEIGTDGESSCAYSADEGIVPSNCISDETALGESSLSSSISSDTATNVGDVFRVVCIHPDTTENLLITKIYTGFIPECEDYNSYIDGDSPTPECNFYEYTAIYNTEVDEDE
jgi:hypothetical protein